MLGAVGFGFGGELGESGGEVVVEGVELVLTLEEIGGPFGHEM